MLPGRKQLTGYTFPSQDLQPQIVTLQCFGNVDKCTYYTFSGVTGLVEMVMKGGVVAS